MSTLDVKDELKKLFCHGHSRRKGYCGRYLGTFRYAQGEIVCQHCGTVNEIAVQQPEPSVIR